MLHINFSDLPKLVNNSFLPLFKDERTTQLLVGGANSSKSFSTAQKYVYKILIRKYPSRILVCRKVRKDVRHSCYDMLRKVIYQWKLDPLFKFNDSETYIKCLVNGGDMIGVGLDDVDKLKSLVDPTDFWVEEADQITPDDYKQLHLRLRGKTPFVKSETLTMNPIWAGHWIKKELWDIENPDILRHHSTYKDNRFLDKDTIRKLENITDPYYRSVYVLGNWGVYGNVVFTKYVIEDFDYTEEDLDNVFTGMDFGYVHASAIERGGFKDGELYIFDELYGKEWTNTDFIKYTKEYFGEDFIGPIRADSAEPDRIEEFSREGYIIEPSIKGKSSLKFGIDFLCRQTIHIHKSKCPNLAREIQSFKRKENRDGEATEEFVEINDDCISAVRYGTEPIWNEYGGSYIPEYDYMGMLGL